jgi:YceI-like domain
MTKTILAAFLFLLLPHFAWADSQWVLEQSTLTYHISHPLHEADGVSRDAAKGKGICHAGECNFLVAVPVKSFNSGNSNRDLHMLQVVLGAEFPLAIVRFTLPESELAASTIHADLEIQFAGQKAEYKQVVFQRTAKGGDTEVTGTIPLHISDFKIKPPELLGIAIKNEVPVKVDTGWRAQ